MDVMPGIASSYIFTLKPGDKVIMSGPYGDFHPIFDSNKEMMWIGGGAGMAPLRAQIMHLTKTLHTTDRKMSYFYSNHRSKLQQIYSLSPLATRESAHIILTSQNDTIHRFKNQAFFMTKCP